MRVLLALIERPGELVTRQELKQKLWASQHAAGGDENLNTAVRNLRTALDDPADRSEFIETVPRKGYRFHASISWGISPFSDMGEACSDTRAAADSIAILPFSRTNKEIEYVGDGLAQGIIHNLTRLRNVRVVPGTTSFRYKGSKLNAFGFGRVVGVRLVLTGDVTEDEQGLSICARLVEVSEERQIWDHQYNRPPSELVHLESEMCRDIATKFRPALSGDELEVLTREVTDSGTAHLLMLRAWHAVRLWSPEGLRLGLQFALQAIREDPLYADAYATLAYAYVYAGICGLSPGDTFQRARAAASRALELNPEHTLALAVIATIKLSCDGDFNGAVQYCLKAIDAGPNMPAGHFAYSRVLLAQAQFEEALAEARRASTLDPLSSPAAYHIAVVLFYAKREQESIVQLEKFGHLDPAFLPASELLAVLYARAGRRSAALTEAKKSVAGTGGSLRGISTVGIVNATLGMHKEAREILDRLETESIEPEFLWSLPCAVIHSLLGERKRALDWLDLYTKTRNALRSLQYDPCFDELRDEPRFQEIVQHPGPMLASDRTISLRDKPRSNGWLGQVQRYVEAHLNDELPITALAGVAQTSAFHFARQFKTITGITPHQYVLRRRVERARLLLKDLGLSIADVAIACGFATQAHLTTVFRKEMGVTPRAFRSYQPSLSRPFSTATVRKN